MKTVTNDHDGHVHLNGTQLLAMIMAIVLIPIAMWQMIAWNERQLVDFENHFETKVRVDDVNSYKKGCPAIAGRLDEYIADGRVTDEENEVVKTLVAQQRALPGGLGTCRYA